MKKIITTIVLLISFNSLGYVLTTGSYVPYFNQAQVDETGGTRKIDINPFFSVGTQMPLWGAHYFTPELGYVYFINNPTDISRSIIYLGYNFSYIWRDNLLFRYGLATHRYTIKGEGGEQRIRNGDGHTTFPSPDKTVTTYYTTLNFGTEAFVRPRSMSIRFDLEIMSFQKLENRAYNYLLTFNWYR